MATMSSCFLPLAAVHDSPTGGWPLEGVEEIQLPSLNVAECPPLSVKVLVRHVNRAMERERSATTTLNGNGKRPAASRQSPNKRAKAAASADASSDNYLANTRLAFRLHASLLEQTLVASTLGSASSIELGQVKLQLSGSSAAFSDNEALVSATAVDLLLTSGDVCAAKIPILQSASEDLSVSVPQPYSLSNGSWLLAAIRLEQEGRLTITSELSLHDHNPWSSKPISVTSTAEAGIYLELDITIHLTSAAFESGRKFADSASALDHLNFMRFINPGAKDRQLQRLNILDGRGVYASLRSTTMEGPPQIQPDHLLPTLMPFQRRSTQFLLAREGKKISTDEEGEWKLEPLSGVATSAGEQVTGLWWESVAGHHALWFNGLTGAFTRDAATILSNNVYGGILAEEMGLGKTVEILALVLLHRSPQRRHLPEYFSDQLQVKVLPSSITLIVAPETLRRQWIDEIGLHAPSLSVYSYQGHTRAKAETPSGLTWPEWARDTFDIVVVSFETLRAEVHVARADKDRPRRKPRQYERPRSPLVQLEYWRVIMDEVQLVGHSAAAETVSMCPRISSVAVSGTLVRSSDDLHSCFSFLRTPDVHYTKGSQWTRMLSPEFAPFLIDGLQILGSRHTKAQVREDLTLPRQHHHLVPIDFTPVETSFYEQVWRDSLERIGLDSTGAPTSNEYELDANAMRGQLLRLRQACTHPQVVATTLGRYDMGTRSALQTLDDVLLFMVTGAKADWNSAHHTLTLRSIDRVRLSLLDKEDEGRLAICRARLEGLRPVAVERIKELDTEILEARTAGPGYRLERGGSPNKKFSVEDDTSADDSDAEELEDFKKKARSTHVSNLKSRQREWYEVLHRIQQFQGNVYFQLGEELTKVRESHDSTSNSVPSPMPEANGHTSEPRFADDMKISSFKKLEDAAYADAEKTRQLLLKDQRAVIEEGTRKLQRFNSKAMVAGLDPIQSWEGAGLSSADAFEGLNDLADLLSANSAIIKEWRQKILARLFLTVNRDVDQENEGDDQYQENLDAQAEAEALLEMYRPLLAEREKIITGRVPLGSTSRPQAFTELERAAALSKRQALLRNITPADAQLLGDFDESVAEAQQQQLELFHQLEKQSMPAKLAKGQVSVTDRIGELREAIDRAARAEEAEIGKSGLAQARQMLTEQNAVLESLKKEQLLMATLFNQRSTYFKAIQELSDQVRDISTSRDLQRDIEKAAQEEANANRKAAVLSSRMRYILGLQEEQQRGDNSIESKTCFMCTEVMSRGVLTRCGHSQCEDCFFKWVRTKAVCPLCKTPLGKGDYERILYDGPAEDTEGNDPVGGPGGEGDADAGRLVTSSKYKLLDSQTLRKIESYPTTRRIGSKLEMLVKFLMHIERTSGAKSLVFSSFARGLDLVGEALRFDGIQHVRLDGGGTKGGQAVDLFRTSTTHNVLLLHSEAQSSGLNLLCATNIFILEPLVNHALELQAISRVNRIGATQESNVYCLYVRATVEERIVSLAATRNRSLYTRGDRQALPPSSNDAAIMEADNHAELAQTARSKGAAVKGDFVSSTEDLLACFFSEHQAAAA